MTAQIDSPKPARLALLTNLLAPYRVPVYEIISQVFETYIFTGAQDNRPYWHNIESSLPNTTVRQSWGFTFRIPKKQGEQLFDYKYFHITPGFLFDLLRTQPDAIITNEMGFRTILSLIYGYIFRKPVWIWWGGTLHTERHLSLIKKVLRKLIVRWSHHWISYGQSSTDYLLNLGVPDNQILQLQNSIDEKKFTQRCPLLLDFSPKPVFLFIGQLLRRKGIAHLLDIAKILQQEGHRFSLIIVGDGPEKETLQKQAQLLSLENIEFYPSQAPDKIPCFYQSADYFVFPTLEDVWGLVVNESLWSNLPVLSSKYAGCAIELLPVENIFDPLNPEEFCNSFRAAIQGKIKPVDHAKLCTSQDIAQMIMDDVKSVLLNHA